MADILSKYLSASYPVPQILMISGFLGTIVTGIWILIAKGKKGFLSPKLHWHVLRAVVIIGISYSVVHAFSLTPLADVYGITFTSPFITLILIYFILKERIGFHRWMSVCVGFTGAFILAGPQFETLSIGLIYAFMAAFLIGVTTIIIRKIGKGEYLPLYAFYPFVAIFLFNASLTLPDFIVPQGMDILFFLMNGAAVLGGLLMVTYAIAHIDETAILSPFIYIQIVWAALFGFFLFGDIPSWTTILGLVLIIGAGLYSIWREHLEYKKTHSL